MYLFENDEVAVVDGGGRGDVVAVFNPTTHLDNGGGDFWGRSFLRSRGFRPVGIVSKKINWFPVGATTEAIAAIKAASIAPKWAYGYSQGGYAALKFSAMLGAPAISLAPQYTIDPAETGPDVNRDYHRFFDAEAHSGMEISADDVHPGSRLVYDPAWTDDHWSAERIVSRCTVDVITVPGCGHDVPQLLVQTGALRHLFDSSPLEFQRFVQRNRMKSALYRLTIARRHRDAQRSLSALPWYLWAAISRETRSIALSEMRATLASASPLSVQVP
ncbi:hypothetical protein N182_18655 [Sinorhizobium sp. GL2]|nr:hypothetical protein N182_18655 [Sinorhizobium sp. GL2]